MQYTLLVPYDFCLRLGILIDYLTKLVSFVMERNRMFPIKEGAEIAPIRNRCRTIERCKRALTAPPCG